MGAIPTSLGEIINFKSYLDKFQGYDEIRINFNTHLWESTLHTQDPAWIENQKLWIKYIHDIGQLFFGNPPYLIIPTSKSAGNIETFTSEYGMPPTKPDLKHILPHGTSLNIGKYLIVTTKIRHIKKDFLYPNLPELLDVLKSLSQNYKIVILGERVVEMRVEYDNDHDNIFGIYDDLISALPNAVDLSVPALGEKVSDLSKIRQDALIIKEAIATITLGVGGNFCLASSCAQMHIGFRKDGYTFTDAIYKENYDDALVTKNWSAFINRLKQL